MVKIASGGLFMGIYPGEMRMKDEERMATNGRREMAYRSLVACNCHFALGKQRTGSVPSYGGADQSGKRKVVEGLRC